MIKSEIIVNVSKKEPFTAPLICFVRLFSAVSEEAGKIQIVLLLGVILGLVQILARNVRGHFLAVGQGSGVFRLLRAALVPYFGLLLLCLLYTSDAADE